MFVCIASQVLVNLDQIVTVEFSFGESVVNEDDDSRRYSDATNHPLADDRLEMVGMNRLCVCLGNIW